MAENQADPARNPSRNERIAFYTAWIGTGFIAGLANSTILLGLAGAGIGILIAWAFELEIKAMGGFFWHELPLRIVFLWIIAGLFMITGAVFGINTGTDIIASISLGLKIGAIHGAILAFIPKKNIRMLWIFPAIGLGIGLLIGGGIGGFIGLLACLLPLYFFEMQQISEYADPQWKNGLLVILLWLLSYGGMVALDICGIVFGFPLESAGGCLGIFMAFILVLFLSRIKYEQHGEDLMALQRDFDKTFPTQDEIAEQPEKVNAAIASIAAALEFYADDAVLGLENQDKEVDKWEDIRLAWKKVKDGKMPLKEFLAQVLNEHGIKIFKIIVGHICPYNESIWH